MKRATGRILLITLLAACCAADARAQQEATAAGAWVNVAPSDESFVVSMPEAPEVSEQRLKLGGREARGRLYAAVGDDSTAYKVWSFEDPRPPSQPTFRFSEHFDELDELAWNLLVRRRWESGSSAFRWPPMTYRGELHVADFGREYRLTFPKTRGFVDIYSVGSRVYIVAIDGPPVGDTHMEPFLDSFGVKVAGRAGVETLLLRNGGRPPSAADLTRAAALSGVGPGRGGSTGGGGRNESGGPAAPTTADDNRPFSAREVTRKAVITSRPVPSYTKSARKFSVAGLVKLRVLLASDGQAGNISIVKGLPHGLTERAVKAARGIRFTPAEKDGRKVSQWIVIEYNFNIY